jgi:hypothetical protein
VVLDLNGDGIKLIERAQSGATFDWDGSGARLHTGWVNANDGILVYDRNGDGTVSGANEISFTSDKPGAKSDLDGLSAFDSNGDGQLGAGDAQWGAFKVWQDRNGDGRVDDGELRSLTDAGVASISLTRTAVNRTWTIGDNLTVNTGSFTRTDGSIGALGDVALAYDVGGAQQTQDVGKVAVSSDLSWSTNWDAGMLEDRWSRFGSMGVAGRYASDALTFDADTSRAANLMVQAMSAFGVKGGVDDSNFKSGAAFGGDPIAVLDRVERYAMPSKGCQVL